MAYSAVLFVATLVLTATQDPSPTALPIGKLLEQLDSDDLQVRDEASFELRKLGESIVPRLREFARTASPEAKARAEEIICEFTEDAPLSHDDRQVLDRYVRTSPWIIRENGDYRELPDIMRRSPKATIRFLLDGLVDDHIIAGHGLESCHYRISGLSVRLLMEIADQVPDPAGMQAYSSGETVLREAEIAAWETWWGKVRGEPVCELWGGLSFAEKENVKACLIIPPGTQPGDAAGKRKNAIALGRRAVPYLISQLRRGTYAVYTEKDKIRHCVATARLLKEITGKDFGEPVVTEPTDYAASDPLRATAHERSRESMEGIRSKWQTWWEIERIRQDK